MVSIVLLRFHTYDERVFRSGQFLKHSLGTGPIYLPHIARLLNETLAQIMPDSFHWLGESLGPDGKTWTLEGEFRAKRMA